MADSNFAKLQTENALACHWISKQAAENGVKVHFVIDWRKPPNRNEIVYKLPTRNLAGLRDLDKWLKRHVHPKKWHLYDDWEQKMLQQTVFQTTDSTEDFAGTIQSYIPSSVEQSHTDSIHLFLAYVMHARSKGLSGFNKHPYLFSGKFTSEVIAHELLHSLGAHDLYVHRYWPGIRNRIVNRKLKTEIMGPTIRKRNNCEHYILSEYSRYCMGWTDTLPDIYRPLLKENYMARWLFERKVKKSF